MMNADKFRDYIGQKVKMAEEILENEEIAKLAAEKEMSMNDVLNNYFDNNFHADYMTKFRRKAQQADAEG